MLSLYDFSPLFYSWRNILAENPGDFQPQVKTLAAAGTWGKGAFTLTSEPIRQRVRSSEVSPEGAQLSINSKVFPLFYGILFYSSYYVVVLCIIDVKTRTDRRGLQLKESHPR